MACGRSAISRGETRAAAGWPRVLGVPQLVAPSRAPPQSAWGCPFPMDTKVALGGFDSPHGMPRAVERCSRPKPGCPHGAPAEGSAGTHQRLRRGGARGGCGAEGPSRSKAGRALAAALVINTPASRGGEAVRTVVALPPSSRVGPLLHPRGRPPRHVGVEMVICTFAVAVVHRLPGITETGSR